MTVRVPWFGGPEDGRVDEDDDPQELEHALDALKDCVVMGAKHPDGVYIFERDGAGGFRWRWVVR